jgi:hypothetical protein
MTNVPLGIRVIAARTSKGRLPFRISFREERSARVGWTSSSSSPCGRTTQELVEVEVPHERVKQSYSTTCKLENIISSFDDQMDWILCICYDF